MTATEPAPPDHDYDAADLDDHDRLDAIEAEARELQRPTRALTTTNGDRIPPHNLDAEESLLGAMLLATQAIEDATPHVTTADYYKPAHAHIHDAITALHARGEPVDPVIVAETLQAAGQLETVGGVATLAHLQAATPATSNAATYARIVADKARLRRLIATAHKITDDAYAEPDPDDATGRALEAITGAITTSPTARTTTGDHFALDAPDNPEPVWGDDDNVLWARGEGLLLVGPPGVGKTTLTGQLLDHLTNPDGGELLGHPVTPSEGRVLYMACDRPRQIARALRRRFNDDPDTRDRLRDRLAVWQGPPPRDFGRHPDALAQLARSAGATTVIIDSLKDVAVNLNDDEVGSTLNRAIQTCLADGIDVAANHHQRKGQNGARPKTLEDVYGSTWITAGAGSVVLLWGAAGDLVVELTHLKQPAAEVGPLKITHDHDTGTSEVHRGFDVLAYLKHAGGATTGQVARAMHEVNDPDDNQRKKTLRRLHALERKGQVHGVDAGSGGAHNGRRGSAEKRWHLVDQDHRR